MENQICALFDMDGVIIDTEPQYDKFWKRTGDRYNVGIENFEKVIKSTTLHGILDKYFSDLTQEEVNQLIADLYRFEETMIFPEIQGAVRFVKSLKEKGIKVGLVTSSTDMKLIGVNREKHFDTLFDTVVSATRVKNGKPNPECYLLAAQDLGFAPENCIVFEDAFAGIEAATVAGMTVVGLATTHPAEVIKDKCLFTIPDFDGFTIDDFLKIERTNPQ
ncbi:MULTISPECIES: HAD family phosphatase [unclassified Dysgonomonas]|uniref:HAD family hydrolase n=1 Tax=unclassified Dysgonomonas TaxID=2630389 RepID=UPI0024756069|nr:MULTISPECIES: HAD family phosphatase [unclassified Dysgonomonas]